MKINESFKTVNFETDLHMSLIANVKEKNYTFLIFVYFKSFDN